MALFVLLSRFVWVGDVISGREVIVGCTKLPNGEIVELVQSWSGDGYTTFVRQNFEDGSSSNSEADHETIKAWSVSMKLEQESGYVVIKFNGKQWKYNYRSRMISRR